MKRPNHRPTGEGVNYWQTISDVLAALMLILLLVILLMGLYMRRTMEDDLPGVTDTVTSMPTVTPYHSWGGDEPDWTPVPRNDNGGGGGGQRNDNNGYQYQEPGWGDYEGTEKAAVHVVLLDGETQQQISEEDVRFELRRGGQLQVLNTYYPRRIAYKEYQTTDTGAFYLPEKIRLGGYMLRELTEPTGYDAADDVYFNIEEAHEWDDPFVVYVSLFPSRNVVRICSVDAADGQPVPGGVYEIVAAQDIVTADGTLRCRAGEVADRVVCDENGEGVSKELYLGAYTVSQVEAPAYYAGMTEPISVQVAKKTESDSGKAVRAACERTSYTLTVRDLLYQDHPITGADFVISSGADETAVTTDSRGQLVLRQLQKGMVYSIRQVSAPDGYVCDAEPMTFSVSQDGRIDGEASASGEVYNRTCRVMINVKDTVIGTEIPDCTVSLTDAEGNLLRMWSSIGAGHIEEGILPGTYRVMSSGNNDAGMEITVRDTEQVQRFDLRVWSNTDWAAAFGGGTAAVSAVAAVILLLIRRRKKSNG